MKEQEEKAMDTKSLRRLDYDAPLLSTRRPSGATSLQLSRASSQGTWRDTCCRIPFSWEQTAGKPKDVETNDTQDMGVPPPKLPPGRRHPPKADQCCDDDDDGCDGDIEEDENDDDVFSDAIDLFSLSESIEMPEPFNKVNGLGSSNSEIEQSSGALSPSFIIQRFLTDANALAASSALANAKNLSKKLPDHSSNYRDGCVSQAVKQSYSAPQGCGFDILFPWRMKHKPCGLKSPVRQTSLNAKPQSCARRKQKR